MRTHADTRGPRGRQENGKAPFAAAVTARPPGWPRIAPGSTSRHQALNEVPDEVTSLTQRVQRAEGVRIFLDRVAQLDKEERKTLIHCERLDITRDAVAKRWLRLRERIREWPIPDGLVAE